MTKNLILWLVIAVILMTLFESFSSSDNQGQIQDYTSFVREVNSDQIAQATFDGKVISGIKNNGQKFMTVMPITDPNILDTLLSHNVRTQGTKPEEQSTLLAIFISWFPMILLIAVWIFFMRQMQGGSKGNPLSFGKSKAKLLSENQIKTTFADVAGCDEAKEDVVELVDFLKDPTKYSKLGGRIPRGVLMVGPPGTGKTLLARAIAGEAKVPFFSISGSDFVEMFVGVGASRVRDMFAQAKKNAPCIIFIDEIDAVGRKRGVGMGGGHDEREQTLNQLLVEMDGFEGFEAVIIIAATNRPDVDTATIARGTPGFSGAELANLVNEAALGAARHNKRVVSMQEFEEAKDKLLMGAERRSMAMNEHEKINTAYHEAGHAIVGKLTPEHDPVYKVSIIPRGRALGVTMYLPEQDRVSQSRRGLLSNISTLFAGRIAEEMMFGEDAVTTGASNDIERATMIARTMVTRWGFSKKLPPMQYEKDNEGDSYLGGSSTTMVSMSEKTTLIIDEEVAEIINSCYAHAKSLLEENKDILENMKDALLKYETIDADQIDDLMNRREVRPPSKPKDDNPENAEANRAEAEKSEDQKTETEDNKSHNSEIQNTQAENKQSETNNASENKEDTPKDSDAEKK